MTIKKKNKTVLPGVDPNGKPLNVELQGADGVLVNELTIPAFYNFPDMIVMKGLPFKFWGRDERKGGAFLLYRPAFVHEVK